MHELSICQALIEQVESIARAHSANQVESIVLRVGPLSGVVKDLLHHAYPVASSGTVAEGAELTIEELPIVVACTTCGAQTEAFANRLICGACGDWHTRLVSGDELLLARVELTQAAIPPSLQPS